MTGNDKLDFLLSCCFMKDIKDLSLEVSVSLLDKKHLDFISHAEKINQFINLEEIKTKIIKKRFNDFFVIDNYKEPIIKDFIIKKLSEFEKFDYGPHARIGIGIDWGLKYDNKDLTTWNWKELLGHTVSYDYAYVFSRCAVYNSGYEPSREKLKSLGIITNGGGSVNDYVSRALYDLKPHVLELKSNLEAL